MIRTLLNAEEAIVMNDDFVIKDDPSMCIIIILC